MQIVINIPKDEYNKICSGHFDINGYFKSNLKEAFKNAILLSKGHGVLKDADVMINKLRTNEASELFGSITCAEIMDFINDEKSIIEADKESEEQEII